MSWECPVCFEKLGEASGLVPMTSKECTPVGHLICLACVTSLAVPDVCPLCKTKTEFTPLLVLVPDDDQQARDSVAAYLDKRRGDVMANAVCNVQESAGSWYVVPVAAEEAHIIYEGMPSSAIDQPLIFEYDPIRHGDFTRDTAVYITGQLCCTIQRLHRNVFAVITVPYISANVQNEVERTIQYAPGLVLMRSEFVARGNGFVSKCFIERLYPE